MESTAQYWKPVWEALERYWKPICQKRKGANTTSGALHLAQAQSNRGRGRKKDFPDAERLVKRLVAASLADQRLRATQEQLSDALGLSTELSPVYRRLLKMMLKELQLIEQQISYAAPNPLPDWAPLRAASWRLVLAEQTGHLLVQLLETVLDNVSGLEYSPPSAAAATNNARPIKLEVIRCPIPLV